MAVFFVAVDDDATKVQRDAFTNYVRQKKWGFWHHTSSAWLIVDSLNRCTATEIRDKAMQLMPSVTTIALEIDPKDYAAFGPKVGHEWLRKYISSPSRYARR